LFLLFVSWSWGTFLSAIRSYSAEEETCYSAEEEETSLYVGAPFGAPFSQQSEVSSSAEYKERERERERGLLTIK
jgi:hypothetical protein